MSLDGLVFCVRYRQICLDFGSRMTDTLFNPKSLCDSTERFDRTDFRRARISLPRMRLFVTGVYFSTKKDLVI